MAKAQISTPEGMTIKIDGTPAEILSVVRDLKERKKKGSSAKRESGKTKPSSASNLVESLIDGGFFKKPQGLTEIKRALAEMGHHFPVTTLSGVMLNVVRKKNLRRQKNGKVWSYVR